MKIFEIFESDTLALATITFFIGIYTGLFMESSFSIDAKKVNYRDEYMRQSNYVWNEELKAYIKVEKFAGFKECCK